MDLLLYLQSDYFQIYRKNSLLHPLHAFTFIFLASVLLIVQPFRFWIHLIDSLPTFCSVGRTKQIVERFLCLAKFMLFQNIAKNSFTSSKSGSESEKDQRINAKHQRTFCFGVRFRSV